MFIRLWFPGLSSFESKQGYGGSFFIDRAEDTKDNRDRTVTTCIFETLGSYPETKHFFFRERLSAGSRQPDSLHFVIKTSSAVRGAGATSYV